MCVKIEKTDKNMLVESEYNPDLPARAKQLGGKWTGSAWRFDIRDEDRVKDLYLDIYGEFGDEGSGDLVTIRVPVGEDGMSKWQSGIHIAGRQVARARGRDSGATLGDGVVLIDCRADSGGSMKNWTTRIVPTGDNPYIEVRDVPRLIAEREGHEIVDETIDKEKLMAEKARLLSRLAEIDALLEGK